MVSDALKQIWEKVDKMMGKQRLETEAEHIARDIREGNFPKRSHPILGPVNPLPVDASEPTPGDLVPDHCTGMSLAFEPGVLHIRKDGSGSICIAEKDFELEDDRDDEGGSVHWIARLDASEIIALRDFLTRGTSRPDGVEPTPGAIDLLCLSVQDVINGRLETGDALEMCGTCMGSGYGGHPDSGALCADCAGSGGMPDVVTRLRTGFITHATREEAADKIERLRRDLAAVKEHLDTALKLTGFDGEVG